MNVTNLTEVFDNVTLISSTLESANPCPRQRNITRPLLFVHNYALFFFGSILNFLAFAILIKRSLRCHTTFAYLAFLSLSNGLLSLVHFSKWMFKYYFNFLFENFLTTCRFHRFSSDFLTHFSLFTLICVNIDRARTVTKNRPNAKYTKSKFHMVLIKECLIAGILCAFHFHWIIKYGYQDDENGVTYCTIDDNQPASIYNYLLTTIYPPFELIVFFCLPLLINIFCTIIIVRSLSIRMRTAKKLRSTNKSVKNETLKKSSEKLLSYILPKTTSKSHIYSCCCFKIQCRKHTNLRLKMSRNEQCLIKYEEENQLFDRQRSATLTTCLSHENQSSTIARKTSKVLNKQHRTRRARDISLSAMLIGLNILYLLLNLPFNLHQTFAKRFHKPNSDLCIMMFISVLLDALQQTFFSTNFFLYVLTNRRFREEFYNTINQVMLNCKNNCCKDSSSSSSNNYQQKSRSRTSSCNPSTAINQTNYTNDQQMMNVPSNCNRDSFQSDIEITETFPTQQQTQLIVNENNKFISKLVMFKDLTNQ